MDRITSKYHEQYLAELRNLHHRRVYYILLAGMSLVGMFALLDYVLVPHLFKMFFVLRMGCVFLGMGLLAANYFDQQQRWPLVIGLCAYLCAGGTVLYMISQMGGYISPYYIALILIITLYTALAPLTSLQTLVCGFFLVAGYLVVIAGFEGAFSSQLTWTVSNVFFMSCFVLIAATQSATDTWGRKHEFNLRQQEKETAAALKKHAAFLEKEIARRTREQQVSEQRYKMLFDNLADEVVLIGLQGQVMQANAPFIHHFGKEILQESSCFYSLLKEKRPGDFEAHIVRMLATAKPLKAYQVTIKSFPDEERSMEVNGSVLLREQKIIGVQLVLRDISTRRRLEKDLVRFLQTIRVTEEATILALANLSEYRERGTGAPAFHLERVMGICAELAQELQTYPDWHTIISDQFIADISYASILHDIGKVSVPDSILLNQDPHDLKECEQVRNHTITGGDFIKSMEEQGTASTFLGLAKTIAYFHHERWDGLGYPHGLAEEEIPLEARIMAVADAYEDFLAAIWQQEQKVDHEWICRQVVAGQGTCFDPTVIRAFSSRQDAIGKILHHYPPAGDETERVPMDIH
ncbi:HD domain-containing phosphohydrolase [Desulfogranum japonicum]|uniref:HD domain-containing phosphohydrolase n=1 Tax=Desulfogranum japonicum TaxID=231447 RepID=UPI0004115E7A|nr:HD domain-containing phosphohydrolase [Desulfogranum japonicum]